MFLPRHTRSHSVLPRSAPAARASASNGYLPALVVAAAVVCGAAAARAEVVAESFTTRTSGARGLAPLDDFAEFSFSVYDLEDVAFVADNVLPPESARRVVFDRLRLTESDVGRTIFVPASEIPGAVELLTNGKNNIVRWELVSPVAHAENFTEWPYLLGLRPGPQRDFAATGLTEIGVKVNSLRLNHPQPGFYDFSASLVFVPEPSAPAALGLGASALLRRRRGSARVTA